MPLPTVLSVCILLITVQAEHSFYVNWLCRFLVL